MILLWTNVCFMLTVFGLTYVNGRCNVPTLVNGRSDVRMRGRLVYYYCNDGFHLYGHKNAKCVYVNWNKPTPICVANGCDIDIEVINGLIDQSYNGSVLTIECVNNTILDGKKTMFCDGQKWNVKKPRCLVPEDIEYCNFENGGFCGWKQDSIDDFDWVLHSGETRTTRTGPQFDHTYGPQSNSGHYIYMEASAPRRPGQITRLLSPWYSSEKSGQCFRFWFHMLGPSSANDVGSLKLKIVDASASTTNTTLLYEISGNQGESWKSASVYIDKTNISFQLQLEAVRMRSYVSDIAVDDLQFYQCQPTTVLQLPLTSHHVSSQHVTSQHVTMLTTQPTPDNSINVENKTDKLQKSLLLQMLASTDNVSVVQNSSVLWNRENASFVLNESSSNVDNATVIDGDNDVILKITPSYHTSQTNITDQHTSAISISTEKYDSRDVTVGNTTRTISPTKDIPKNTVLINFESSTKIDISTSALLHSTPTSHILNQGDHSVIAKHSNKSAFGKHESSVSSINRYSDHVTQSSLWRYTTRYVQVVQMGVGERTLIVNLCVSIVVVTVVISVLILFIALCRRRQRKYEEKYTEMKRFVETHYRNRYI